MKKNGVYVFVFQTLFYATTIFVVHLLFFDFWNPEYSDGYLSNWLPILIIDAVGGLFVGALNGLPWLLMGRGEAQTSKAFIVTGALWLMFCFWWYFINVGTFNREPVGHLLSPMFCGIVAIVSALMNFGFVWRRQREVWKHGKTN